MNERRLTHNPRRRSNSSSKTNRKLVQLLIGKFDLFRGWAAIWLGLWLKRAKLFNHASYRIFTTRLNDFASLKLVWIDVPYKRAQRLEVFASRGCLIVLFDERNRHGLQVSKVRG